MAEKFGNYEEIIKQKGLNGLFPYDLTDKYYDLHSSIGNAYAVSGFIINSLNLIYRQIQNDGILELIKEYKECCFSGDYTHLLLESDKLFDLNWINLPEDYHDRKNIESSRLKI